MKTYEQMLNDYVKLAEHYKLVGDRSKWLLDAECKINAAYTTKRTKRKPVIPKLIPLEWQYVFAITSTASTPRDGKMVSYKRTSPAQLILSGQTGKHMIFPKMITKAFWQQGKMPLDRVRK